MKYINLFRMPNGFIASSIPYETQEEAHKHRYATSFVGVMRITDAMADLLTGRPSDNPKAAVSESPDHAAIHRALGKRNAHR